jgi:lactate permease
MADNMYFLWSWTPVLVLSVLAVGFKQSALALSIYGALFSLFLTAWVFQTPVSVVLMAGVDGIFTTFPLLLVIIAGILLSQLLMTTGSLVRIVNWFMLGVPSVFLRNLLITIGVGNFMEGASVIAEPVVAPMLRASGVLPIGSAALSIIGYSGLMTLEMSGMILAVHSLITGLPIQSLAIASAWLSIPAALMMAACIPFFLKGSEDDGIGFGRQLVLSLGSGLISSIIALMAVYIAGPALPGMIGGLGLMLILIRIGIKKMSISRQIWLDLSPFAFMMAALLLVNTIPFLKTLTFERLRFTFHVIPVHPLMLTPFYSAYLYLFLSAALAAWMFRLTPGQISQVIRAGIRKGWRASLSMALFGSMGQIIAYSGYSENFAGLNQQLHIPWVLSEGLKLYTGGLYPVFVPVLGWAGTFLTGYGVASLMLFGQLQIQAAWLLGVSPVWLSAGLAVGASIGSISSPFKIALAAPMCGAVGKEGDILRWTIPIGIAASLVIGIILLAVV